MTYWSGHVGVAWRQFTKITFDVIYILIFSHLYMASSSSSRSKDACWKTDMNADLKATSEASLLAADTIDSRKWNMGEIARKRFCVQMSWRSNYSICLFGFCLSWFGRQKKHNTFPWGKCRSFIDIDEMSDSAELKNMLSAQYTFILNVHVVNKVQLVLRWSDARFKIKVAKQIATWGLRRYKKTQILIDYQSRTEFKTRLGQKSKCQPLISVMDSIARLLNGNRVTAFVTQHASIVVFD